MDRDAIVKDGHKTRTFQSPIREEEKENENFSMDGCHEKSGRKKILLNSS